jgi:bifunctional DNA-binding transcriptional regulator/antitoxin component of YhaV-PrlF toxin-antitoxin module
LNKSSFDPEEKIIQVTQITRRHQTTVPAKIMKFLGINPKGGVVWILKNKEVVIRKQ